MRILFMSLLAMVFLAGACGKPPTKTENTQEKITTEPVTEKSTEPAAEPTKEPTKEPVKEPTTEPSPEPVQDQSDAGTKEEPGVEPTPDTKTESVPEAKTENVPETQTEATPESGPEGGIPEFVAFQPPKPTLVQGHGWTDDDNTYSVAYDSSGNIYVTGSICGSSSGSCSVKFDSTFLNTKGGGDIFILKMDSTGKVLWAKNAGGTGDDYGGSIAVNSKGEVFVAGAICLQATSSCSGTFGSYTLNSKGDADIFLTKLDATGKFLWVKGVGGTGEDYDGGLMLDKNGNPHLVGSFCYGATGSCTATVVTDTLTSKGGEDIFMAKFDDTGKVVWAKSAGGTGDDFAPGLHVDGTGNVHVSGYICESGAAGCGATFGTKTLTSKGESDAFVAKLDSSGNTLWAISFGSASSDYAGNLAVNATGEIFLTGSICYGSGGSACSATVDSSLPALTIKGEEEMYIAKFDANGVAKWAKTFGSTSEDYGFGIALDSKGNVHVAGYFCGGVSNCSISFGNTTLNTRGTYDIFLAKFNTTGSPVWAVSLGSSEEDLLNDLVIDGSDNLFMVGTSCGGSTGSCSLSYDGGTLKSDGKSDGFLAKFPPK